MDKLHFHEIFTGLCIKENERATSFLKCFTYGKTTAEAALNTDSEEQLVDFVLAGLHHTRKESTVQQYSYVNKNVAQARRSHTMRLSNIYLKLMRARM
jgi:hypothetical protein